MLVELQPRCRHLGAGAPFKFRMPRSSEAWQKPEMKTWPDCCAALSSNLQTKVLFNFTNSLSSFFFFLAFFSDPAEIHALYFTSFFFLTISLLNSLTRLQPGGFFLNLGQDACVKYAEDGITASEAKPGFCSSFFFLNDGTCNWFLFSCRNGRGGRMQKIFV